ncbi:MAG: ribosome maturation factor [Balneolaceae bacterium]
MQTDTINIIKVISQPIVEQRNMFLIDVEIKHQKIPEIWILVDSEEGDVDLRKCSEISRELSLLLEENELLKSSYRLNVSSPGLSRPLSDIRQYPKNLGRTAKVKFKKEDNYFTTEGVIEEVNDGSLTILQEDGEKSEVEFDTIVETKIIPKI